MNRKYRTIHIVPYMENKQSKTMTASNTMCSWEKLLGENVNDVIYVLKLHILDINQ